MAWLGYVVTTVLRELVWAGSQSAQLTTETVAYLVVVTLLVYSALAYLLARQGYLYRTRSHRRVPRAAIEEYFRKSMPTLTVLVPAYQEDARVIRQTLLSAALQEYPSMRIVLLIDDAPLPANDEQRAMLDAARALPGELNEFLAAPRATFEKALERFESTSVDLGEPTVDDMRELAEEYERAVRWLDTFIQRELIVDHTDRFLAHEVVGRLADDLRDMADAIRAAANPNQVLPRQRFVQLYRRLVWTFRAELTSFERRQYASLSHDPTKAANLNSYIGLMGSAYKQELTPTGPVLTPAPAGQCDLDIPDSDYVLPLDADSVLLPEYCLRLVYLLEQPEHQDVAVAQTPYSAYPGAATRLGRLAGATTDLQHNLHQGSTHYDATFWVGANAVIRKVALDDLLVEELDGGVLVRRYIQDRTPIEDTESTIDLGIRGWKLFNYPERLSYSTTPLDFGSLCIQRQRWANGGLRMLPRLWRHLRRRRMRGEKGYVAEAFLRLNYLASISWVSFGLIVLLVYPFSESLLSPLIPLAALPYFLAMASDLRRAGYERLDVLRIYGFNLLLLPVNIAGVLQSLVQTVTRKKIAFARTPKVRNRTTTTITFLLCPFLLVAGSVAALVSDVQLGYTGHAAFAAANALLASYAIVAFIGLINTMVDIGRYVRGGHVQRVPRRRLHFDFESRAPRWALILHHGTSDVPHGSSVPASLFPSSAQPTHRSVSSRN